MWLATSERRVPNFIINFVHVELEFVKLVSITGTSVT